MFWLFPVAVDAVETNLLLVTPFNDLKGRNSVMYRTQCYMLFFLLVHCPV